MSRVERFLLAGRDRYAAIIRRLTGRYYHDTLPLVTIMAAFFGGIVMAEAGIPQGVVVAATLPLLTIAGTVKANRRWSA